VSAIAGVFQLDGSPVARPVIAAMLGVLSHRGAGGQVSCADHVALGQIPTRVRGDPTIDPPLEGQTAGPTVVADARIDNREELARELGLAEAVDDRQLILHAYLRWGARCAERLVGDFAFAIWDPRRQVLFCARDPMGVKPLYVHRSARLVAFASEIKALLAHPAVSGAIDDDQVARYLGWSTDDRERTLYKHIDRVPAAHILLCSATGATQSRYWTPDAAPDVRFGRADDYATAFREIFRDSVAARMRGADPVAATLSGGLDSSAIVCMARELRGGGGGGGAGKAPGSEIHTFSLVFPTASGRDRAIIDERFYIDLVTRRGGMHAHEVRGDCVSPLGDVRRVLWHLDQPHSAPNLYLHWAMYEAAQRHGARVLLDGFDGDSAVSHGLGRLDELMAAGHWALYDSELRSFAERRAISVGSILPHFGLPYLSALARDGRWRDWLRAAGELHRRFGVSRAALSIRWGLRPLAPNAAVRLWQRVRGVPDPVAAVLRPTVRRRLALVSDSEPRASHAAEMASERSSHVLGIDQPAYQRTLETADACAAAFGIEPRYPFFDRRLIEFCIGLPADQKLSGGFSRCILRRAMEGTLPPEIQWRSTKGNLAPNFRRRLREVDLARALDFAPLEPYADVRALNALAGEYRRTGGNRGSDALGGFLHRAAVLATWLTQTTSVGDAEESIARRATTEAA
jgi:asparagine synthase (glutamine-hydrolysing)